MFVTILSVEAQNSEQSKPTVVYGQNRKVEIGGITVDGVQNYDDNILIGLSGLTVGETISFPGDEITDAVKRYWKHGLFSNVKIEADSIVGNKVYLKITLATRPRVSQVNVWGVKKSEQKDLMEKMGLAKGNQLTPNMVDKAKIVIKHYFEGKGFRNATVEIIQRDDPAHPDMIMVDVNIDKKEKVKVRKIYITGNNNIKTSKFHGNFFSGGLLKKTNEKGFKSLFKAKKFIEERYAEDKERVIDKYNELGFRDAAIVKDSIVDNGDNTVDIYLGIEEGDRYYVRDIKWVGNSVYTTDALNRLFRMKRGDVYNQKHIKKRLNEDEDAVANFYYNQGYVFNQVVPVEVDVDGDSIDLEIRRGCTGNNQQN